MVRSLSLSELRVIEPVRVQISSAHPVDVKTVSMGPGRSLRRCTVANIEHTFKVVLVESLGMQRLGLRFTRNDSDDLRLHEEPCKKQDQHRVNENEKDAACYKEKTCRYANCRNFRSADHLQENKGSRPSKLLRCRTSKC